jgi:hypothetical protein
VSRPRRALVAAWFVLVLIVLLLLVLDRLAEAHR